MGASARAIEAGRFGVDQALLCQFVPMNDLAAAHSSQPVPFAGVSERHPSDSIPTSFKTSNQAYYVVQVSWRETGKLVSRAFPCAFWRTD